MKTITNFFFSLSLLLLLSISTNAQVVCSNDTTYCPPDSITLWADVTGTMGTSNYTFSFIPFTPEAYTGTPINLNDDDVSNALPIGFDFCFLGNTYNQFYFGSNGWISFPGSNNSITYTSDIIPNMDPAVPKNCIMAPWEDWHPGLCVGPCLFYQTIGTAPNRKLICTWLNVPMYQCTSTQGTFQVVIHETTNIIENFLDQKPSCPTWANGTATQGVHDITGTIAYTVPGRNSTQWQAQQEGVRFEPSGVEWFVNGIQVGYGDSLTVAPNQTTTYEARVSICDGGTGTSSDSVTVFVGTQSLSTTSIDVICNGDANGQLTATMNGTTGPWDYIWTDTNNDTIQINNSSSPDTLNNISGGTYYVEVFAPQGCGSEFDTLNVIEPSTFNIIETISDEICNQLNGSIDVNIFGSTPPYTINWDNGSTDSLITNLAAGNYNITITDDNNCSEIFTYTINNIPGPSANFTHSPQGILTTDNMTVNFTDNSTTGVNWFWDFGDGNTSTEQNPTHTFSGVGTYLITLTVTDGNNCTDLFTITIEVDEDYSAYFPNAFSPNLDGINDVFYPQINGINNSTYQLVIFDRWGEKLFETNDPLIGWNGNILSSSKNASQGVYSYKAIFATYGGKEFVHTGIITLIK